MDTTMNRDTMEERADRVDQRFGDELTTRVPSSVYLGGMLASVAISIGLYATGRREAAIFTGLWAPTILNFGLYNKLLRIGRGTSASGRPRYAS